MFNVFRVPLHQEFHKDFALGFWEGVSIVQRPTVALEKKPFKTFGILNKMLYIEEDPCQIVQSETYIVTNGLQSRAFCD